MPLSSAAEPETDRSVGMEIEGAEQILVSVPTTFKPDDDAATMTDGIESIYNPNYSIHTLVEVKKKFKRRIFSSSFSFSFLFFSRRNIFNQKRKRHKISSLDIVKLIFNL